LNEYPQITAIYNYSFSKTGGFMAQTVIGFFDNAEEGRKAVNQLQEMGLSRDNVDITENSGSGNVSYNNDRSDDHENGITRFFKSLFGDDDDRADRYSRVGNNSRCIVTVHARSEDEAERAADILDSCGAIDVDERASQYGAVSSDRSENAGQRRETTIPRVEENLQVGKRTEERGGVIVRSRIVERPVEEHIRLREEHVNVERQPVNRPVSADEQGSFRDREIELTERSEVPVVNKEARVVEEIKLSKEVSERDETVRDTVRNTEVDIQNTAERSRRDTDTNGRSDRSL
jgi:stress response protein YsnF